MEETKQRLSVQKNVRFDKSLYSVDKYTLRIKPYPETNSFEGHVEVDLSIKDHDLNEIYLHMQNLTVNKFQISFGETLHDGMPNFDETFVDHTY